MPRVVQPRVSFQGDIGFLSRLSQAVELDQHMTPEEKREAISALSKVSTVLHGAEIRRLSHAASDETTPTPVD
jgi:hypothetical protein